MVHIRLKVDFDWVVIVVRILVLEQEKASLISMGEGQEGVSKVNIITFVDQLLHHFGLFLADDTLFDFLLKVGCLRVVKLVGTRTATHTTEFLVEESLFLALLADLEGRLEASKDSFGPAAFLSSQPAVVEVVVLEGVRQGLYLRFEGLLGVDDVLDELLLRVVKLVEGQVEVGLSLLDEGVNLDLLRLNKVCSLVEQMLHTMRCTRVGNVGDLVLIELGSDRCVFQLRSGEVIVLLEGVQSLCQQSLDLFFGGNVLRGNLQTEKPSNGNFKTS